MLNDFKLKFAPASFQKKCYQSKPFLNDEEKLKCLFDMYADKSPESERLL